MSIKHLLTTFGISALLLPHALSAQIRIACVGNSITYGSNIENREEKSYPAQLQTLLGAGYEVGNFGSPGSTLLSKGDYPYTATNAYRESIEFNPNIVIIKLGTNDSKPQNRAYLNEYISDYVKLIERYKSLPTNPRIVLLTPVRCFNLPEAPIDNGVISESIIPKIKELAFDYQLELLNLYYLLGEKYSESLVPDRIHPSALGASIIAQKIYDYLKQPLAASSIEQQLPLKVERTFNFHGFKGLVYNNNGVEYYLVLPHRRAAGNPWMIRARFWGHEPQADIAMLEHGYYLAYCDVADLYGSPTAVKRWNTFYQIMRKAGAARKVVLEGMSRGGLIVYNWAAANPSKVACIYADAPVMDIKSWPMGVGGSKGSSNDVSKMLKAYGFTSNIDAMEWKKNPVDHARVLAKHRVPMLHIVGDDDDIVPIKENTSAFEINVKKYGHVVQVIHKPGIGHHPHSLSDPAPIVDFILKHK